MVNLSDFTAHEKELVLRAKEILTKSPNCYLIGSLMLKLRGFDLGRECMDLDFCVEDDGLTPKQRIENGLYSIGETSIFVPEHFQKAILTDHAYSDFAQFQNFDSGDKIDYFYVREKNRFIHKSIAMSLDEVFTFKIGSLKDLIEKKEMLVENSKHEYVVEKHLRDLFIISEQSSNRI